MNYAIPENEVPNIISVFWQMLREIESHTDPKKDPTNALLVEGAYRLLDRANIHKGEPDWITQKKKEPETDKKYIIYTVIISGNERFPFGGLKHECTLDDIEKLVNYDVISKSLEGMGFNYSEFDLREIKNLKPGESVAYIPDDCEACAIGVSPITKSDLQHAIMNAMSETIRDQDEEL